MNSLQLDEKAIEILKNVFGFSNYRYGQKEIVESILTKKQTLAIMPTGAGKSLCYQLPAVISKKKTIVIAPLIALIEDQVSSLKECGVNVDYLDKHFNTLSKTKELMTLAKMEGSRGIAVFEI